MNVRRFLIAAFSVTLVGCSCRVAYADWPVHVARFDASVQHQHAIPTGNLPQKLITLKADVSDPSVRTLLYVRFSDPLVRLGVVDDVGMVAADGHSGALQDDMVHRAATSQFNVPSGAGHVAGTVSATYRADWPVHVASFTRPANMSDFVADTYLPPYDFGKMQRVTSNLPSIDWSIHLVELSGSFNFRGIPHPKSRLSAAMAALTEDFPALYPFN